MRTSRSVALFFLGLITGLGLAVGSYYVVREYAPDLAVWYLRSMGGTGRSVAETLGLKVDPLEVRSIVGDVLASDEGKAVITDSLKGSSKEALEDLIREAAESPEFRKMLSDVLKSFLSSPEGQEILREITREILAP